MIVPQWIQTKKLLNSRIQSEIWTNAEVRTGAIVEAGCSDVESTAITISRISARAGAGGRIQDTGAGDGRRHCAIGLRSDIETIAFIVSEEEKFIANYPSTK